MPDESSNATPKEADNKKLATTEQTSQAALAGAIGLIAGACTDNATIKGIVAALAPFVSLGIFWLVRVGGEEWKAHRKRKSTRQGLDDYLRQIQERADQLPPGCEERLQLEADAREVSRIRHQYIVKELTGSAPSATPTVLVAAPLTIPLLTPPTPPLTSSAP